MKRKLVLLDIDGVLVRNLSAKLSDDVASAIKNANNNFYFSFCTGRGFLDGVTEMINACGLENNYHIIESGTKIAKGNGRIIKSEDMMISEIIEIYRSVVDYADEFGFNQNGIWISDINDLDATKNISICSVNTLDQQQTERVYGLLSKFSDQFSIGIGTHYSNKNGACIHVTKKTANKGYATEYLQKLLEYSVDDSVGFGDMPMDVKFLSKCRTIICPSDAHPDILRIANYTFPPIEEYGFIKALEILNNLK